MKSDPGRRLVFIGDIHGCFDELRDLLSRVGPSKGDVVVSLGDMVRKGPDAVSCLELWRERGYLAVRGNNEVTLLRRAGRPRAANLFLSGVDRAVLRRRDLLDFLRSWPLVVDFQKEGIAAVHGGVLPDMRFDDDHFERHTRALLSLRWIRKVDGEWRQVPKDGREEGDKRWSTVWNGDRFVVYGHTPFEEPRFDRRALGIDTGCVYGGTLTAAVWRRGKWSLVSVPARRAYARKTR